MRRRHSVTRAKTAVLSCLLLFVAVQVTSDVVLGLHYPESHDAEFAMRLTTLRARIAEDPGRLLVLMVGSSRTVASFIPEILPPTRTADGRGALVFNFSHLGAGPAMNLVEVQRLLRAGIRPDYLVLEIMPSQLGDARQSIITHNAGPADLPVIARYLGRLGAYGRYVRSRLVPRLFKNRSFILGRLCPGWVPVDGRAEVDCTTLGPLGGYYALRSSTQVTHGLEPRLDAREVRRRTAIARAGYWPTLQRLQLCELSDRANRDLLRLCRQRHIQVALLLSPEGSEFQSWYTPEARRLVEEYCFRLSRQFDVPVVDARNWLPDDNFTDSHHVMETGARAFTERLDRELLRNCLAGEQLAVSSHGPDASATAP